MSERKISFIRRNEFGYFYDVVFEGENLPEKIELFSPDYEKEYRYSLVFDVVPDTVHSIYLQTQREIRSSMNRNS